jgi:hypothetical protein
MGSYQFTKNFISQDTYDFEYLIFRAKKLLRDYKINVDDYLRITIDESKNHYILVFTYKCPCDICNLAFQSSLIHVYYFPNTKEFLYTDIHDSMDKWETL